MRKTQLEIASMNVYGQDVLGGDVRGMTASHYEREPLCSKPGKNNWQNWKSASVAGYLMAYHRGNR